MASLSSSWPASPALARTRQARLERVVSARAQAKRVELDAQERYRDALIATVEADVASQRASWEAAKAARLAVLRALHGQALAMVGEAQKLAAAEDAAGLAGALASAGTWSALAKTAVGRGATAAAVDAAAHAAHLRSATDRVVFRSEAHAAAAAEERAWAERQRAATAAAASAREATATAALAHASARARSRSSSRASTASSVGGRRSRRHSAASSACGGGSNLVTHPVTLTPHVLREAPSRLSRLYGPRADAGVAVDEGSDAFVRVLGLPRVPSVGPHAIVSSVRAPFVAHVVEGPAADAGDACAAAAEASERLAAARAAAGALSVSRAAEAVQRGVNAGRGARESREGLRALEWMEALTREGRGGRGRARGGDDGDEEEEGGGAGSSGGGGVAWRGGLMPSARGSVGSGGEGASPRGGAPVDVFRTRAGDAGIAPHRIGGGKYMRVGEKGEAEEGGDRVVTVTSARELELERAFEAALRGEGGSL